MSKKDIIVLGLGNPLVADEGIGTVVAEKLGAYQDQYPDVEFVDAGAGGMQLLHYIAGRKKAVIIDCAFMGEEAGTIKRFTVDEVKTVKKLAHLSLHEVDIIKVIELSKQLGECPDEVVFFGIEPETVEDNIGLSARLENKLNEYISAVVEEIK